LFKTSVIIVTARSQDMRGDDNVEFQSVLREAEDIMTDGPMKASENKENQQVLLDEVDFEYRLAVSPSTRFQRMLFFVFIGIESESQKPCSSSGARGSTSEWARGHRRAWSMPNAKGDKMTLAIIQDKETKTNGNTHRRRVLRCHILVPTALKFDLSGMPPPDEDDNELEVEINEEEVEVPGETGKGARTVIKRFWEARWKATNFEYLPEWLQDNEYLRSGHRPPLPSFSSCFKSIFVLHTETGNIWTHMYGCVAFIGIAFWFLTRPSSQIQFMDKVVFSTYFLGAILCLGLSFIFHTVACHSDTVGKLFSKLDYAGIALLIIGSFIPWVYYAFYCRPQPMIIYITMISVLGLLAMIVSLWDKFAQPAFRPLRAGIFVAMGLSAVFPAAHLLFVDGLDFLYMKASLVWMLLMGGTYIGGAAIYATRIPERFFPGRCDLWFQSHQLFHTFVIIAALIHFHSITEMAQKKLMEGSCAEQLLERYGIESNPSLLGGLLGLDEDPNKISWNGFR
uniref:Adiponectin receptor protein n=1 Tax=Haemonchus placei TaxID=6290 RepID=A0A0N4W6I9_HAEPC